LEDSRSRLNRAATLAVAATLFLLFVYSVFLSPRPYFVTEIDIEQDYYYNARVISDGWTVASSHHPGTPIYYLGALVLRVTGPSLDHTQRFFHWCYVLVALATAAALIAFRRVAAAGSSIGVAALASALIVVWPPFLTYSNRFGSDSFVVALGLPTLAFFWRALRGSGERHRRDLFFSGAGAGACLATKMSFVPVVGALLLASSLHSFRFLRAARERQEPRTPTWRERWMVLCAFPVGLSVAYLVLTAPILLRLPDVWINTFRRREAYPPTSEAFAALARSGWLLATCNPAFAAAILGIAAAWIALLLVARAWRRRRPADALDRDAVDSFSGHVLVAIMLCAFLYTLAASALVTPAASNPGVWPQGAEAGIRLRNVSPSALVLPFLVLDGERLVQRLRAGRRFRGQALVWIASLSVLAWGFVSFGQARRAFVKNHLDRIAATREKIVPEDAAHGRTAFWTGASMDYLGDLSFHFWGNYRYARGLFDEELLRRYPRVTFFGGLREMARGRLAPTASPDGPARIQHSRFGPFGDMIWRWNRAGQIPERKQELFAGETAGGARLSQITIPTAEMDVELGPSSESRLLTVLRERLGDVSVRKEAIAGRDWLFLTPGGERPRTEGTPGAVR
jgi:hypothetical protein